MMNDLKYMRLVLIMIILIAFTIITIVTGTTAYELWKADDNLMQSEIEISGIIDERTNITREQKDMVINTICNNRNSIHGMSEQCKMDMVLKYMV